MPSLLKVAEKYILLNLSLLKYNATFEIGNFHSASAVGKFPASVIAPELQ